MKKKKCLRYLQIYLYWQFDQFSSAFICFSPYTMCSSQADDQQHMWWVYSEVSEYSEVILASQSQIRKKGRYQVLTTNKYILILWTSQCTHTNSHMYLPSFNTSVCLGQCWDLPRSSFLPRSNFLRISSSSDYNFASFSSPLTAKFFQLPGKLINNTIYVIKSRLCFFCSWVPYQLWQYIMAGDIWTRQSHHLPPSQNICTFQREDIPSATISSASDIESVSFCWIHYPHCICQKGLNILMSSSAMQQQQLLHDPASTLCWCWCLVSGSKPDKSDTFCLKLLDWPRPVGYSRHLCCHLTKKMELEKVSKRKRNQCSWPSEHVPNIALILLTTDVPSEISGWGLNQRTVQSSPLFCGNYNWKTQQISKHSHTNHPHAQLFLFDCTSPCCHSLFPLCSSATHHTTSWGQNQNAILLLLLLIALPRNSNGVTLLEPTAYILLCVVTHWPNNGIQWQRANERYL